MNTMSRSARPSAIVRRAVLGLGVVLVASACSGADAGKAAATVTDSSLMQEGVDMMYKSADPIGAEAKFRQVLTRTPTHYGAHYQLAVALDRGGKPTEARAAWEDMRQRATAINDTATLATARRRLAAPDTASVDAMMALGLHLLYKTPDAAGAALQFRKVLAKNPTHYGATYQLAKALDITGQRNAATPQWEKVLGMATQYRDTAVMRQALDRLK